ncbi:PH domain-containing protein [Nakamurella antarctica]|uniref:PH domain-containing protein n=1 Tax=Nakamurella antarctica TaxID=1902245 RepID=A0A3G8ZJN2_9ACTN|nr:PH domain-containing protein [Nakamurella antarctica]AZI57559.1 PH domain-containing protein [Nakamurella antarctica]
MTTTNNPVLLTVRPRKITYFAGVGAAIVVAVTAVVGVTLRSDTTGVYFRTADAVSMIVLGLLFAGGMMLVARPRLRVYADVVKVRNIFGEKTIEWPLIHRVAFPEGSQYSQLELADDEMVAVMAIQAMDKERAVAALQQFRALFKQYGSPPPVVSPEAAARRVAAPDPHRPLGRLEQIDLQRAAEGKTKKRFGGR